MAWRDLLAARVWRTTLRTLQSGGGYAGVYQQLKRHFPDEPAKDLREASRRILEAYEAGKSLSRAGRVRAPDPEDIPWLLGSGRHPPSNAACRFRYDVTAEYRDTADGSDHYVNNLTFDADRNLTPAEIRAEVESIVAQHQGLEDTLPGGSRAPPMQLRRVAVNVVFRC